MKFKKGAKAAESLQGLCEKCRSCIIYWGKAVIFPSVRLCVHSRRGATNGRVCRFSLRLGAYRADAAVLWGCLERRRGALVQPKLEAVTLSQAGLTEVPALCGCPWPTQACFSSTRWVFVRSFWHMCVGCMLHASSSSSSSSSSMMKRRKLRLRGDVLSLARNPWLWGVEVSSFISVETQSNRESLSRQKTKKSKQTKRPTKSQTFIAQLEQQMKQHRFAAVTAHLGSAFYSFFESSQKSSKSQEW